MPKHPQLEFAIIAQRPAPGSGQEWDQPFAPGSSGLDAFSAYTQLWTLILLIDGHAHLSSPLWY